ncbi:uncharacterized protein [Engystomops pustulosus]|uniref:uncharacterized protein n=1 Tax=Engystomops pustulosus TaxID=76066 RepID=UPI003AFB2B71
MGRLDDHAKNRIVMLRRAGLSFRKIKNVLELDNIKVTPQAIYLFLKRKNIEPENYVPPPQIPGTKVEPWQQAQLWSLMQNTAGPKTEKDPPVPSAPPPTVDIKVEASDEEDLIKIVKVESMSEEEPMQDPPSSAPGPAPQDVSQGARVQETCSGSLRPAQHPTQSGTRPNVSYHQASHHFNGRARTPLPAPRNPALLVTKKLVDKAITLQKKVIFQNGGQQLNQGAQYSEAKASTQVIDASTQTAASFPPARLETSAEQLDSIRGELQKLTQVMHNLIDRQNRWEQEQMRQRQSNHQEVLSQIQQLGAKLPQTIVQQTETHLPDIGHFKIELL